MGKRGPVKGSVGVVSIYNGAIADMRKEGQTLQMIGNEIGVTRERVRQILNEYYGGTTIPGLLPERQVAKICGIYQSTLLSWRIRGLVSPKKHGKQTYRYDRSEIEKVYLLLQRKCVWCGMPIKLPRVKYCEDCAAERKRYNYPFFSEEQKVKARQSRRKWRLGHLEQIKEINQRAYRAKKKALKFG